LQRRHGLPPWSRRLALGGGSFVVAFALDVATQQRWSIVLGGTATAFSLTLLLLDLLRRVLPLVIYLGTWLVFNAGRAVADNVHLAVAGDTLVAQVERGFLGGRLPSNVLQAGVATPTQVQPYDAVLTAVHLSFFVTPMLAAMILFVRHRVLFRRYVLATMSCLAIGLIGFTLVPTTPPWLLSEPEGAESVVRIAGNVLASLNLVVMSGTGATPKGYVFEPNHLASMPSIHVAAVALIACAAWSSRPRGTILAAANAYWLLMAISVVYLGEHYVLDVLAGTAVTVASWQAAGWLLSRCGADWQAGLREITAGVRAETP
jgi:membrane-associated phospholipid phosphatase